MGVCGDFELPPEESRIVGRIQQHEVAAGETLANIAKQYDIGFLSLAANKGVDPYFHDAVPGILVVWFCRTLQEKVWLTLPS